MRATALYDFEGCKESGEICFKEGDEITVLDRSSNDGWWEGRTNNGKTGAFPRLYVEIKERNLHENKHEKLQESKPKTDAPPTPPVLEVEDIMSNGDLSEIALIDQNQHNGKFVNDFELHDEEMRDTLQRLSLTHELLQTLPQTPLDTKTRSASRCDSTRTEETNISNLTSPFGRAAPVKIHTRIPSSSLIGKGVSSSIYVDKNTVDDVSLLKSLGLSRHSNKDKKVDNLPMRSLNRYSWFVSSGSEDFLRANASSNNNCNKGLAALLDAKSNHHRAIHQISLTNGDVSWKNSLDTDNLIITGHVKRTKYFGTKQFTAYQIFNRANNTVVFRRYKHFEWLQNQLMNSFSILCVPPLPEKLNQDEMTPDFITARKRALERYLNRISQHPVLGQSAIFQFFITCSDDNAWKTEKRKAEQAGSRTLDEIGGELTAIRKARDAGRLFLEKVVLETASNANIDDEFPSMPYDTDVIETVGCFHEFIELFQDSSFFVQDSAQNFQILAPVMKKLFLGFGNSILKLSSTSIGSNSSFCWKKDCVECAKSGARLGAVSSACTEMSELWESHMQTITMPLLEELREYDAITKKMTKAIDILQSVERQFRSAKTLFSRGKMQSATFEEFTKRYRVVKSLCMAEINHYHDQRLKDQKRLFDGFMKSHQEFYQNLAHVLSEAKNGMI